MSQKRQKKVCLCICLFTGVLVDGILRLVSGDEGNLLVHTAVFLGSAALAMLSIKVFQLLRMRTDDRGTEVRKAAHIAVTIMVMLIVSRFLIRIVDATVQIDDDIGILVLMLIVVNAAIGSGSYMLYRYLNEGKAQKPVK